MCGICGMAGPEAEYVMVQNMCAGLAHRGPDGEGIYEDTGVVLGHRRTQHYRFSDR